MPISLGTETVTRLPDSISAKLRELVSDYSLSVVWPYGSRVYGCQTASSDFDFIGVGQTNTQIIEPDINITIYDMAEFGSQLAAHEISVIECTNVPPSVGKQIAAPTINSQILRSSISKKANNSWVRAKKKLVVRDSYDYDAAIKSLFHTYRIYCFGVQLAKHSEICDFSQANWLIHELRSLPIQTWEELDSKYRQLINGAASAFRVAAPKATT